ncbi:MAG: HlyD family efflux transporter periplasmic adaptor subunit [Ruminococcaceae bacterium]|nr:HlyD family efflux transporter periplasmic adaptor subunit [Oscillospiraceae bacterium]
MADVKVKNRAWVKNAAIVFLTILLILTFFSNTIMNKTMPEVATAYVQSGAINTRIRGSGTIVATENYEIKTQDARTVKSVLVRAGQKVELDEVLILLGEGDSDAILALQSEIADLNSSYQQKLVTASSTSSSVQIKRAREKLQDSITKADELKVTPEEMKAAKDRLDKAKKAVNETPVGTVTYAEVEAAAEKMTASKEYLDGRIEELKLKDEALTAIAEHKKNQAEAGAGPHDKSLDAWKALMAKKYGATVPEESLEGLKFEDIPADVDNADIEYISDVAVKVFGNEYQKTELAAAYVILENAKADYEKDKKDYEDKDRRFKAENGGLLAELSRSQKAYDALTEKKAAYDTARDEVVANQVALEQLLIAEKTESIELNRMRRQLGERQAKLAKLMSSGTGSEIKSPVAGVAKDINITAGNTADPSAVLMTVEVPDRGYSVTMSVTKEQAGKVTIGTQAEVSTGYWGTNDMVAKLVSFAPDKENPNTNRLLVFDITGKEIESGTQVNLSIGEKTRQFDAIVPNAAVKSDTNGSFVLVVESKSSPLGNRYVARRVDVSVLATDDQNSAVQGGVGNSDYVITSSTKPIENGMLVRLAG